MVHQSRIGCLVVDCKTDELSAMAQFWSAALGYEAQPDPKFPEYIMLKTAAGEAKILLQAVDHQSRVHLDIETDDKDAERDRLVELGAKEIGPCKGWIVMEAPSGHRFCIVGPQRPDFNENATKWEIA